jgi:ACR3 family arsenite efflux pump ArsB
VVPVDSIYVLTQVMIIILVPLAAAILTRRLLIGWQGERKFTEVWIKRIPALSTLGMFGVLFSALALKARALAADPGLFLMAIPPLIVFYIVTYSVTILLGRWLLQPADAKALIFGVVVRSISVSLALAINAFGEAGAEAALFIAIAYIVQTPSAAWFVRYADRVFPAPHRGGHGVMHHDRQ